MRAEPFSAEQPHGRPPVKRSGWRQRGTVGIRGVAVIGILALAACASAPKPTEQLAVARAAVDAANTEHAAEHAPLEMKTAQEKLRAAESAAAAGDNEAARRLAEQAEIDALLAGRKAQTARAQQAVAELRESIRVLQQEIR